MQPTIQQTIHIHASPEQVWDALTNPDKIAHYLYGARTYTDWQPGSPIQYQMEQNGEWVTVVKGEVVIFEPPHRLESTLLPLGWNGLEDVPENYLTSTYEIAPAGKCADLTVTMHDYTRVGMGEQRYADTLKNFDRFLAQIKEIAEQ
jgi:uncharacterized protein YndB with AHSA1/START domain